MNLAVWWKPDTAEKLASGLETDLDRIRQSAGRFPRALRAFFEEWDDPIISGIRWVEELVTIAGGTPVFPELATAGLARDRIVDAAEIARRDPEVIFASWCGKKVRKAAIRERAGWDAVSAVRENRIFEVKSTYILQPGPACLTEGVRSCTRCSRVHRTARPADRAGRATRRSRQRVRLQADQRHGIRLKPDTKRTITVR